MSPQAAPRTASFPRPPLLAAAGLISFALLAAVVGRVTGSARHEQLVSTAIAARDLRFEDRADGAVLVYDATLNPTDRNAQPIAVAVGENGFLRGTLRGFARSRRADDVGMAAPFRLTAWADGRLTLLDPTTGRYAELEAFGSDNERVFAAFLQPPGGTQLAAATAR